MLLALALMLMTTAVVASVVVPLMRAARPLPDPGMFDRAVYRDQLEELERDVARGLIEAREAASARLEIERRLLAADRRDERAVATEGSPRLAVALALAVPMAAVLVYLAVGSPGIVDQPLAARVPEGTAGASPPGHDDFAAGAAKLEQQLAQNPADAGKWLLLARTEAELGRWPKSVDAYRHLMALTGNDAEFASPYGEMLVMEADGIVTPAAQQQFAAALAHDPGDVPARFYTGLAAAQAGEPRRAIELWTRLAADVPAGEIRTEIIRRIDEAARAGGFPAPTLPPAPAAPAAPPESADLAAPGPSAADIANAAQMSDADRQAMIRTMVERLATQLQSAPGDLDGWLRLARAYAVLGERDKAIAAYQHAETLLPAGSDQRQAIATAIAALGPGGTSAAAAPAPGPAAPGPTAQDMANAGQMSDADRQAMIRSMVERLATRLQGTPGDLDGWMRLGRAYGVLGERDKAIAAYQHAETLLPAGSDQRQAVAAAIAALQAK